MLHEGCLENLLPSVSDRSSILGSENCQSSSSIGETINLVRPADIKQNGATEAEAVTRMVDYADMKDAAAQFP